MRPWALVQNPARMAALGPIGSLKNSGAAADLLRFVDGAHHQ
jgi:hypothetical protein